MFINHLKDPTVNGFQIEAVGYITFSLSSLYGNFRVSQRELRHAPQQDGMGHSSELLDATKRAAPSAL
jgi:hypothetical protein